MADMATMSRRRIMDGFLMTVVVIVVLMFVQDHASIRKKRLIFAKISLFGETCKLFAIKLPNSFD